LAYIGNIPAESYASFETETFSVSATANYTLSHAVTNENEIRLVINGVVQQPGSGKAYTASGTTLTLTSATVSGDSMYAVYLGRALQTVNPPNASVGSAQVADSLISGKTALGATPADTDELLISDAGTLKRVDYSYLKSANTPAFSVGKSGDQSIDNAETMTKITWDTEHLDTDNAFASNKFTVPSGEGGTYFISFNFRVQSNTNSTTSIAVGKIYKNGSILHNTDSRVDFRANPGRGAGITSTVLVTLSAGDYIEFYGGNNATGGTSEIQYRGTLAQGFKILT
jgi:hypothetical protein